MKKTLMIISSLIASVAFAQSIQLNSSNTSVLPIAYSWAPNEALPIGWTAYGMGFYTTGNTEPNAGKFDTAGDSLLITVQEEVAQLNYSLKGNSLKTPYQFVVLESMDGVGYDTLMNHTEGNQTLASSYQAYHASPLSTTRYIKFVYQTKTAGNIAIDDVALTDEVSTRIETTTKPKNILIDPANSKIEFQQAEEIKSAVVYNLLGEVIISKSNLNGGLFSIDTHTLTNGIYFVSIHTVNNQTVSYRFVR